MPLKTNRTDRIKTVYINWPVLHNQNWALLIKIIENQLLRNS